MSANIQYKISIKHTTNCTLTNFGPHSGIVTTDNWRLYGYKSGSFLSNTGCYQVQSEFIQTGVLKSNSHVDADCQGTQFTSNVQLLWLRCPHCAADFGLLVTDPEGEAVYLGLGDPMTTTVE